MTISIKIVRESRIEGSLGSRNEEEQNLGLDVVI